FSANASVRRTLLNCHNRLLDRPDAAGCILFKCHEETLAQRRVSVKKKCAEPSAFFHRRVVFALLLCTVAAASIFIGTLLAFHPEASTKVSPRTLTFAQRVAYQRAIEEVYWRHRIWPKERSDAKPSFDAVTSQGQIEKKVADYLRDSQALEDYRQGSI